MLREAVGGEDPVMIRNDDREHKTNNAAEWLALREALQHAKEHHAKEPVLIHMDSRLVVNQFNGRWATRVAHLHRLRTQCRELAVGLKWVAVVWRPRLELVKRVGH